MALTRITKGVIKPNENYDTHNINSTGIVTAIGLDINGNGDISGNLSVGGVLTYEDVTSIDSVGIITAQKDIHVGAGVSVVGIVTAATFKGDGDFVDIDVDGHTNLDNVNIVGVTTISQNLALNASGTTYPLVVHADADYKGIMVNGSYAPTIGFNILDNYTPSWKLGIHGSSHHNFAISSGTGNTNKLVIQGASNGGKGLFYGDWFATNLTMASTLYHDGDTDTGITFSGLGDIINLHTANTTRLSVQNSGIIVTGVSTFSSNIDANGDLDVDGHTNLDNVSIAGVTTFSNNVKFDGATAGRDVTFLRSSNTLEFATNAILELGNSGSGDCRLFNNGTDTRIVNGTGTLRFESDIHEFKDKDNSTQKFKIDEAGNVRVANTFDCVGVSTFRNNLFAQADLRIAGEIVHLSDDDTRMQFPSNDTIVFKTAGSERLRINSSGNVTISRDLDVDGHINLDNVSISGISSTGNIYITTGGDGRKLSFAGDGSSHYIKMDHTLNGPIINGYGGLAFETNGTNERLRIASNGNIVINNSSPVAGKLEINVGTESNSSTEYHGEDFAINIRANTGESPNEEGNGICFSQRYATADAGIVRTGAIVGYKIQGDGAFGGGLKFKTQQAGANPFRDIMRMRSDMIEIPHDNVRLHFGVDGDFRIRHTGTENQIYSNSTHPIVFSNSGGERFRITSAGKIGIGTDNPKQNVSIANGRVNIDSRGDYYGVWIDGDTNATSAVNIGRWHNTGGRMKNGGSSYNDLIIETMNTAHNLQLQPTGGKVAIGTASPTFAAGGGVHLKGGNEFTSYRVTAHTNTGVDFAQDASGNAYVYNRDNADLLLGTNNTQKLRIYDDGYVIIGDTSKSSTAGAGGLDIQGNSTNCVLEMGNPFPGVSGGVNPAFRITATNSNKIVDFESIWGGTNQLYKHITFAGGGTFFYDGTSNTEVVRVTGSGLVVGTTNYSDAHNTDDGTAILTNGHVITRCTTSTNNKLYTAKTIDTGSAIALRVLSAQTQVGSVSFNSGGTSFNTSSDYRRKENVIDLTGAITRLKTLKPKRFNFISNPSVTLDGFLAHEVTAVPEAVTGTKDEVATEDGDGYAKGDPIYQQLDQSKLVPLLVAALQEAVARIEALEGS